MTVKNKWNRFDLLLLNRQWHWVMAVATQEGMSMAAVIRTLIEDAMERRPIEYKEVKPNGTDQGTA